VVTNFHVAGHAEKVWCTLADRTRVPAKLLGGDPATDLAVLRLDLAEVQRLGGSFGVAKLGATRPVEVGQIVLALGSPRGLSMSLSQGVVSNTDRYLGDDITLPTGEETGMYNNWIQTDAAINPGNSGGPLVNLDGEVVGINSRGIAGGDGLGFSIPAPVVKKVYAQIVETGKVTRAWIGLDRGLEPLGFEAAQRGVRIGHVDQDSPAHAAGLRPGDVITALHGEPVDAVHPEDIPPIRRRIAESALDKAIRLTVRRGAEELTVDVVPAEMQAQRVDQFLARRFGLTVRAMTEQDARRSGTTSTAGVVVTGVTPGGPAATGGLRPGDVVLKVGAAGVADLESFKGLYAKVEGADSVLLGIRRGLGMTLRALTPSREDGDEEEDE
jgi:serine protease Do